MGDKTKIDWCDASWNPVTGCLHGCEYCYARGFANRFKGKIGVYALDPDEAKKETHVLQSSAWKNNGMKSPFPYGFEPTLHCYKLDVPRHWKKPRTIFVCSMADLFGDWVPDEWIKAVFDACVEAPHHRYLFLTKNPPRYMQLYRKGIVLPPTIEWWYGYTIDGLQDVPHDAPLGNHTFVSVEPIQRRLTPMMLNDIVRARWIIVGAETGNRKGRVIPEKSWIDEILWRAHTKWMTPVFMKESLRGIMRSNFCQEFPWEDYT